MLEGDEGRTYRESPSTPRYRYLKQVAVSHDVNPDHHCDTAQYTVLLIIPKEYHKTQPNYPGT